MVRWGGRGGAQKKPEKYDLSLFFSMKDFNPTFERTASTFTTDLVGLQALPRLTNHEVGRRVMMVEGVSKSSVVPTIAEGRLAL